MVRSGTILVLFVATAFAQARRSRWDPPNDLPHLASTPALRRALIDELIKVLLDPDAGRDSLDAKEKLVAMGPRVFPRVLSAMARVSDGLTDDNNAQERLLESCLKLADETLRGIDPYLNEKNKSPIRPGSEKKYIRYILRLHYKRWKSKLESLADTEVHVFAVRDGGVNNVTIERARAAVVLVLVSQRPAQWTIVNPNDVRIARVMTNGTLTHKVGAQIEAFRQQLPWNDIELLRSALPASSTFHARRKPTRFVLHFPGPMARDVEVHAIGIREAKSGVATVEVRKTARPVVLVLMARKSVGWKLVMVDGARVAGVVVSGEEDQHVVGLPRDAVLIERAFFAYEVHSKRALLAEARIKLLTGKGFASLQTSVSGADFVVK